MAQPKRRKQSPPRRDGAGLDAHEARVKLSRDSPPSSTSSPSATLAPRPEGLGALGDNPALAARLRAAGASDAKTGLAGAGSRRSPASAAAPPLAAPPPPPPPQQPAPRRVTPEELMREAFDRAFDGAVAKFLGEGFDASGYELVEAEVLDPRAAPLVAADAVPGDVTTDDLVFVEAMAAGAIRRTMWRRELELKSWSGLAWRTEAQLAALTAEQLRFLELTGAQRDLLARSRRHRPPMRTLHVRGLRLHEAMGEVEAFVRGEVVAGARFARIIHGKGKQSAGDAVLKPEVVRWCGDRGAAFVRAWAPDVDASGQFGSVVLELHAAAVASTAG